MNKNQISKVMEAIGPAVKGSLVEVRKPCIRPNCPACKDGRKHLAFMFHYAEDGKRRCMYVPRTLVSALREALANGRRIEQCLHAAGPKLIKDWRQKKGQSI